MNLDNIIYSIQVRYLCGPKRVSGIRGGATMAEARAINATLRPSCGRPGRDDNIRGIMILLHGLLKTRGETLQVSGAMMR